MSLVCDNCNKELKKEDIIFSYLMGSSKDGQNYDLDLIDLYRCSCERQPSFSQKVGLDRSLLVNR